MFSDLYLITTNPRLTWSEVFTPPVVKLIVCSILFHTVVYTLFFNLASFVFVGAPLSWSINRRMIGSLLIIMAAGFVARFFHVKEVYGAYQNNLEKTRNHLDQLYIGWIFLS